MLTQSFKNRITHRVQIEKTFRSLLTFIAVMLAAVVQASTPLEARSPMASSGIVPSLQVEGIRPFGQSGGGQEAWASVADDRLEVVHARLHDPTPHPVQGRHGP